MFLCLWSFHANMTDDTTRNQTTPWNHDFLMSYNTSVTYDCVLLDPLDTLKHLLHLTHQTYKMHKSAVSLMHLTLSHSETQVIYLSWHKINSKEHCSNDRVSSDMGWHTMTLWCRMTHWHADTHRHTFYTQLLIPSCSVGYIICGTFAEELLWTGTSLALTHIVQFVV